MSRAEDLADLLGLTGPLREAMLAVPRDVFVPDVGVAGPANGGRYAIDRHARPDEWRHAVFSDTAVITQWDDEQTDPAEVDLRRAQPSSSISAPGVAFAFLAMLAPRDHDRVLEIGTGTGYTAAVLAARVGEHNVTSIEVDPAVAGQAEANLKRVGYAPRLVVGDGADGWLDGAPYDRVHATCAVRRIPGAWVAQTRPGGVIVVPWQPGYDFGWIVRLTVAGGAAHGRFHGRAGYMMLRDQRAEMRFTVHHEDQAVTATTRLDPRSIVDAGEGAELAITALVPDVKLIPIRASDGTVSVSLYELGRPEGAWAACDYEPGDDEYEVTQYGGRRLWDEAEAAYLRWLDVGSPGIDRFGVTVTAGGQHTIWIDAPGRTLDR
ncbi:protein-L-isoaspartate(D-aspartate) O-methyltransferase [Nocardiopsis mwathae]|uniref:Protein-L-isoaspartate O-methyltransferase n=1 Tax=Nocardiopsis mwathae TaxID=1472723 RepID=A0A7W9YGE1_9ACTN|nr:methyltransferase domain-containing protein [Nocardiopsis mwathae]MBB6171670.1 protein-L-isoaspartate(D-aspartate) O-methyltransferase [Nocardiopsis mwathae]